MEESKIAKPATRAALGDIKNQDSKTSGLLKKATAVLAKKEEAGAFGRKVEPRRPLRAASTYAHPSDEQKITKNERVLRSKSINITKAAPKNTRNARAIGQLPTKAPNHKPTQCLPAVREEESIAEIQKKEVKDEEVKEKPATNIEKAAKTATGVGSVVLEKVGAPKVAIAKEPVAFSSNLIKDIDAADGDDPILLSEYVADVYEYLSELEKQYIIRENFLQEQPEITPHMRAVLVDWLVQVHLRFRLLPETMFTAVNLIDRYLQATAVKKEQLQLVGVTGLFLASKYEEMYSPEISDFVYITDRTYTKEEIRGMERKMLRLLCFALGRPLPIHFLRRFSKAADADAITHTLAKYFMELSLVEYNLAHFLPSTVAASALWLSLKLQGSKWTPELAYYSKNTEHDLFPCIKNICKALIKVHYGKSKLQAVREKFSSSKFFMISRNTCLRLSAIKEIESHDLPEDLAVSQ